MSGHALVMPILIIFMGGEMIYILDQRLHAQDVPEQKQRKVLRDVVNAMFSSQFLDEIFQSRTMWQNQQIYQSFVRLINSSVMVLNKYSMEKLYDLMLMGVKYQVLNCRHPRYLVNIILKKIRIISEICLSDDSTDPLLDAFRAKFQSTYEKFTDYDFYMIKQNMCKFFYGKYTKIFSFLKDHIQKDDGSFILNIDSDLSEGIEMPGVVKILENNALIRTEKIYICSPKTFCLWPGYYRSTIGDNMYAVLKPHLPTSDDKQHIKESKIESKKCNLVANALHERNLLKELINIDDSDENNYENQHKPESKLQHSSIFIDGSHSNYIGSNLVGQGHELESVYIDLESDKVSHYRTIEGKLDIDSKIQDDNDGDDLLSLMDKAK